MRLLALCERQSRCEKMNINEPSTSVLNNTLSSSNGKNYFFLKGLNCKIRLYMSVSVRSPRYKAAKHFIDILNGSQCRRREFVN